MNFSKKKLSVCLLSIAFLAVPMSAQQITQQAKERAAELVKKMTLEEKLEYIGGYKKGFSIRGIPRLGIPEILMADGPQGVRNDTKSTMYACGIASAATWNREVSENMGKGLGQDARARGVHIMLGPGVNIYRMPLCGRNFEYFGEDPYLASETAVAYINGMQSQGVMATIKHFAGNNQEWDRHHVSSDIDERTLNEIYFPAFRKAVQVAKTGAVMSSYNMLNGQHATENRDLTIHTLRDKWGFEGIFMSDWNATYSCVGAANNGLDLEMPSGRLMNPKDLKEAIDNGIVDERTIDLKVQHILQALISFGFFDRPQLDKSIPEKNEFSNQAALEMAREGIVLLKNEASMLPLKKGKIVVCGPNSGNIPTGGGSGYVHPFQTVSVGQGMQQMGSKYKTTILANPTLSADMADYYVDEAGTKPGLKGEYFNNKECNGKAVATRTDNTINFNWKQGSPMNGIKKDGFSIRWTGYYIPKQDGVMLLQITGDDGFRMFINDTPVINDWRNHKSTKRETCKTVKAGEKYKVRIEYYDNSSDALISFKQGRFDSDNTWKKELSKADVVVFCAGFNASNERENSDRTFELPDGQEKLIDMISQYNKNLIVLVNSGGSVNMNGWSDKAKGILMTWYPGQEGGLAIAEILTGKVNPSGHLPITLEKKLEDNPCYNNYYQNQFNSYRNGTSFTRVRYKEGIFNGYRGFEKNGVAPLYPFGYGLSYTTFAYSNLKVEKNGSGCVVSFDIKNTGKVPGAEVAQVYVGDVECKVVRPVKELKGYQKIYLKKGETKHVEIPLDADAFKYYDIFAHDFVLEPGDFNIYVGASVEDIRLKSTVNM